MGLFLRRCMAALTLFAYGVSFLSPSISSAMMAQDEELERLLRAVPPLSNHWGSSFKHPDDWDETVLVSLTWREENGTEGLLRLLKGYNYSQKQIN